MRCLRHTGKDRLCGLRSPASGQQRTSRGDQHPVGGLIRVFLDRTCHRALAGIDRAVNSPIDHHV